MISFSRGFRLPLIICSLIIVFSGCTHSLKKPSDPEKALKLISKIRQQNTEILSFKGIGSAKLVEKNKTSSFRLAWAGEAPDKLRLTILFSGKPLETFAADGRAVYIRSHTGQHKFIRYKSKNADLKRMIAIPLRINELIHLFSGKIPLKNFTTAGLEKSAPGSGNPSGYTLTLYRRFKGPVQRLFLTKDFKTTGYEILKRNKTIYSVAFDKYQLTEGFSLPYNTLIKAEKASCKIAFSRYFPNSEIKPGIFTLSENR